MFLLIIQIFFNTILRFKISPNKSFFINNSKFVCFFAILDRRSVFSNI